jgi:hypothetical protein
VPSALLIGASTATIFDLPLVLGSLTNQSHPAFTTSFLQAWHSRAVRCALTALWADTEPAGAHAAASAPAPTTTSSSAASTHASAAGAGARSSAGRLASASAC